MAHFRRTVVDHSSKIKVKEQTNELNRPAFFCFFFVFYFRSLSLVIETFPAFGDETRYIAEPFNLISLFSSLTLFLNTRELVGRACLRTADAHAHSKLVKRYETRK